MWYKVFVFLCLATLYIAAFQRGAYEFPAHLGQGVVRTTIPIDNMILEMDSKHDVPQGFKLIYYVQHGDNPLQMHNQNLFHSKKYMRFLTLAAAITSLPQEEIAKGIRDILLKADKHPYQVIVTTPPQRTTYWDLHFQMAQKLFEIQDRGDNLPRYFCLIGNKRQHFLKNQKNKG